MKSCVLGIALILSPLLGLGVAFLGAWLLAQPIVGIAIVAGMFFFIALGVLVVWYEQPDTRGWGEPH